MSKQLLLTQGQIAIVDDADYEWLNRWKWRACKSHHTWYAVRTTSRKNGKQTMILMHRLLLGLEAGDPRETDHKDGNGLNNRKSNLRIASDSQNSQNRRPQKGTSIYKGVYWHRHNAKWHAHIKVEGRSIHLSSFDSEIEAARAYDAAARNHFGEFARLNFRIGDI